MYSLCQAAVLACLLHFYKLSCGKSEYIHDGRHELARHLNCCLCYAQDLTVSDMLYMFSRRNDVASCAPHSLLALTLSCWLIADHMWWASSPGRASHPNPEAPRCLPCDFDDSKFDQSLKPFNAPKGCPCTAQLLCETDERGIFNQYCDVPKAPMSTYSMHGGAGGIISIGMLRAVSLDYMEKCVKSLYSTGMPTHT